MNWLKLICARVFGWTLVWTIDHDGEYRLRRVYFMPDGTRRCHSILSDLSVELREDGTTRGKSYVEKWVPCHPHAAALPAVKPAEEEWAEYLPGGWNK